MYGAGSGENVVPEESREKLGGGSSSGNDVGGGPGTPSGSGGSASKVNVQRDKGNLEQKIKNSTNPVKVKEELIDYSSGNNEIQVMETDGNVFDVTKDSDRHDMTPLNLGGAYNTVRAARKAASNLRQLNPDSSSSENSKAFSFANGDERTLHCHIEHNLRDRLSKCFSFDPQARKCDTCPSGGHAALKAAKGGPVAIVGADQAFPVCLPKTDGNECVRITRVEYGSLQEIVHALADAIGGTALVKGTVFLIGLLSHLSTVGTGQYIMTGLGQDTG